jgi:hypothetical protein
MNGIGDQSSALAHHSHIAFDQNHQDIAHDVDDTDTVGTFSACSVFHSSPTDDRSDWISASILDTACNKKTANTTTEMISRNPIILRINMVDRTFTN